MCCCLLTCNTVQSVGQSTRWLQLAALTDESHHHTFCKERLKYHKVTQIKIDGVSKSHWSNITELYRNSQYWLFQKISEFSHEGFLQSYKEAETSFRCTNISDIFHLTALWFCFCVAAAENLSQDWRQQLPKQLTKWLQFCIVLSTTNVFSFRYNWFYYNSQWITSKQ